jgi:hypothetical protein
MRTDRVFIIAFVSAGIWWGAIGFLVGYDMHGLEASGAPVSVEDRPLVAHPSILNPATIPAGPNTIPQLPLGLQVIGEAVLNTGRSPTGKARAIQTDEDGYAICSPERKP